MLKSIDKILNEIETEKILQKLRRHKNVKSNRYNHT